MQAAVIIVVGGVIIAGAALCAASRAAVFGLITLPLAALITQLLLQPERIQQLLAAAIVLFGFIIVRMCREMRRSIVAAFEATLRSEELLERVEQTDTRLHDAIESCPEGIAVWDAQDRLLVCNEIYARIYGGGLSAAELVGTPFVRIAEQVWEMDRPSSQQTEAERYAWLERLVQRHREGGGISREYQGRDGRWRQGSTTRMRAGGWVGLVSDITELKRTQEELERREEMVRFLAYHDSLTGVPNRRLLEDRLRQAVFQAQRRSGRVAAMLIDLDDFKQVNDSAGHGAGDLVLQEVAMRLAGCLRKADTLARQGGDEFVIVMSDVQTQSDCQIVAEKILRALEVEFRAGGSVFKLGAHAELNALFRDDVKKRS
jgi:diguanylate cyclase (GGDEF)-like protein/PAS domain S-box-containing protein